MVPLSLPNTQSHFELFKSRLIPAQKKPDSGLEKLPAGILTFGLALPYPSFPGVADMNDNTAVGLLPGPTGRQCFTPSVATSGVVRVSVLFRRVPRMRASANVGASGRSAAKRRRVTEARAGWRRAAIAVRGTRPHRVAVVDDPSDTVPPRTRPVGEAVLFLRVHSPEQFRRSVQQASKENLPLIPVHLLRFLHRFRVQIIYVFFIERVR